MTSCARSLLQRILFFKHPDDPSSLFRCARRRLRPWYRLKSATLASSSHKSEGQHCQKNYEQPIGRGANAVLVFGQDGNAPIDEFEVNPVDQQRGLSELNERA